MKRIDSSYFGKYNANCGHMLIFVIFYHLFSMSAFKLYDGAKNHSIAKKRTKCVDRHLLPPLVKKKPIGRYLDRSEHERKVSTLRDLA